MTAHRSFAPQVAIALVVAAALYTAALCFVNTRITGISNTTVAIVDGVILLTALALATAHSSRVLRILLIALAGNFLLLVLLSGNLDLKAVRDPLVLIAFVALGARYGGFTRARFAFFAISAVVLAFALFEFLWPEAYTSLFNVIGFYAARGMFDADAIQQLDSAFFVSGVRDDARMLLPWLGQHRVASIFLEPVSMGNFGALAIAFALSLDRTHWRTALAAGAVGIAAIVLADARFGSMAAILFILARLLPANWTRIGLPLLPLIAIGMLIGFGLSGVGPGDDLPTRLAGSGRLLLDMDLATLFGLSGYEIVTFDSGYAYAFSAFGLPFCVALWIAFILLPAPSKEAQRFKLLLGVYICALLCISGTSLFALKTAALAFFIMGALVGQGAAAAVATRRAAVIAPQRVPAH